MTKNNLVIVESPAKAKTIGRYLGNGYTVKASMGHVRDLPKSKIGIDFDHDFQPDYQPIKGKEEVIADLKEAAEASDNIYLATDPDREGEAISWHLKELLEIPNEKTYRVTFNEITKRVVTESIAAPRPIDQNLVDAQQARRPPALAQDPSGTVRRSCPVCGHSAGGRSGEGDPCLRAPGILVSGRNFRPHRPPDRPVPGALPRGGQKERGACQ